MQAAHDFNVERFQGVACGLNEVDAGMDSVIHNVHSVHLVLGLEIGIESLFNVLHNGSPRVIVVDKISKAGGINHSQAQTDAIFLNVGADGLNRDRLWDDVQARALAFAWRI